MIRKAELKDLPKLNKLYEMARGYMRENGNPNQWGTNYPSDELITEDIKSGVLYTLPLYLWERKKPIKPYIPVNG